MEELNGVLMIRVNGEIKHIDIDQISNLLSNNLLLNSKDIKPKEQAV
ncbi:TPA: hypothetical protein PTW06_003607 [Clostridium botulinum]|nr:hypothetical protein [Clostridium botulinum]HDK7226278.1 hypothetical protein [Clostridium botulinum]HDK7273668.1 hypothetical protein [Clostridium botulinum]HDK7307016.1 hypothetical protein [Clostridium botulinum]HDK7314660.1 hypothetical protein [Clostridium botulinum]